MNIIFAISFLSGPRRLMKRTFLTSIYDFESKLVKLVIEEHPELLYASRQVLSFLFGWIWYGLR